MNTNNVVKLSFEMAGNAPRGITAMIRGIKGVEHQTARANSNFLTFTRQIHHAAAAFSVLRRAGRAMAAPITHAIKEATAFEETVLRISGTLGAFDVGGDFDGARRTGEFLFKSIEESAARLPGVAEDYIKVFELGLPGAIRAGMNDLKDIEDLTNKIGAFAAVRNIEAGQAGRDLMRMLTGRAGLRLKTFNQLKAYMGDIAVDAETFNKATGAEKVAAIQKALGGFQEMFDAYQDTRTALEGTAKTYFSQVKRAMGAPIAAVYKGVLARSRDFFQANQKSILETAYNIGVSIANFGIRMGEFIRAAVDYVKPLVATIIESPVFDVLANTVDRVINQAGNLVVAFYPVIAVIRETFDALNQLASGGRLEGLQSAIDAVLDVINTVGALVNSLAQFITPLLSFVGPGLLEFGKGVLSVVEAFIGIVVQISEILRTLLAGDMMFVGMLFRGVGKALQAVAEILRYFETEIGQIIIGLTVAYGGFMAISILAAGKIGFFIGAVVLATAAIGLMQDAAYSFYTKVLGELAIDKRQFTNVRGGRQDPKVPPEVQKTIDSIPKVDLRVPPQSFGKRAPKGGGGKVNNFDFRGSRFTIEQRFAEGFDPDRVAVTMANDLAKLGEMRMQSSLLQAGAAR